MSSFFLQPLMLAWMALVAIPIAIFLWNRRRYQRRKWAAMEFLLRALKKNRRRLQIENLLLLAIRCAILVLLAAAMARPFLRGQALTDAGVGGPQNWVLALDTSYSMQNRDGIRTVFESARDSLAQLIQEVARPGDRIAVVTFDARPRIVLSPRQLTDANRAEIASEVAALETGHQAVSVPRSLETALEACRLFEPEGAVASLATKKLVIFSDFQRRDWLAEGNRDSAIADALRRLKEENVQVSLAALSGPERNLSVLDLGVRPALVGREVWVEFSATIANRGREDFEAAEIVFSVDGVEERVHVARLPAGESPLTRTLPYRFSTPGPHTVTVEVRGDGLLNDNSRYLALRVEENAEVLVVDGSPGLRPLDRESLLVELALLPEDSDEFRRTPYRPTVLTADQLGPDLDLGVQLAVLLLNVAANDLPSAFVDALRQRVRRGGALLVFGGDNVRPQEYNALFRRPGEGPKPVADLLPLPIAEILDRDLEPLHFRFAVGAEAHPVARFFLERAERTWIGRDVFEVRRALRFEAPDPASEDLRPILAYDDPAAGLAVFDAPCGQGRVLWFGTSASLRWNDFAKSPDFVPFLHESLPYLIAFGSSRLNLRLGEPIREMVEAADFASEVALLPPRAGASEAAAPAAVAKNLTAIPGEDRFLLLHEDTGRPGLYTVRFRRASPPPGSWAERDLTYAVNLDPAEGDLRPVARDELREGYQGEMELEIFDAVEKVAGAAQDKVLAGGTEFWRPLLWAVVLLLAAESALACFFGRKL